MNDIEELQSRISAAMARVADGLDALSAGGDDDSEALRQELEDEKLANAQLSERLRVIGDDHARALAEAERALAEAQEKAQEAEAKLDARLIQMDSEVQQVRKANAGLREANQALREANEAGVGDPDLINKAMRAELEALRADRAAQVAQSDVIIDALMPLIQTDEPQPADSALQEDV